MSIYISFPDLYDPVVIQYTGCCSIGEFFETGGIKFNSPEEFKAIAHERLDALVSAETPFDSWEEFTAVATNNWIRQQLRGSRRGS